MSNSIRPIKAELNQSNNFSNRNQVAANPNQKLYQSEIFPNQDQFGNRSGTQLEMTHDENPRSTFNKTNTKDKPNKLSVLKFSKDKHRRSSVAGKTPNSVSSDNSSVGSENMDNEMSSKRESEQGPYQEPLPL